MTSYSSSIIDRLKSKTELFLKSDEQLLTSMPVSEILALVSELNQGLIQLEQLNKEDANRPGQEFRPSPDSKDRTDPENCSGFSINSFGYFEQVSQACADLLGVKQQELRKVRIFKFIRRDHKRKFFRQCLKALETGQTETCSLSLVDKEGNEFQMVLKSQAAIDRKGTRIIECQLTPE